MLPRSALGLSADRIPFHCAWDTGGSGGGPYLRCLDTRAVRTSRIHFGPRAETRGRCMRRLRRPRAPITVSGGNRSRLIHCLTGSGLPASGRPIGSRSEKWAWEEINGNLFEADFSIPMPLPEVFGILFSNRFTRRLHALSHFGLGRLP